MQQEKSSAYRDSGTLKLAAEINDFVRSRTEHIADENRRSTFASVALEAARVTFSLVPWPPTSDKSLEPSLQLAQVSE
jgi:hypothetical protein